MPFGDIHIGKYWNASTNVPFLRSSYGTPGDAYIVSVAGSTLLNGINIWNVGDVVVYGLDGWLKLDGGGGGADTIIFPSIAAASSAIIPAAQTFVLTVSYTAGTFKGGALYKRVGSAPGHNFYFSSTDENGVVGYFEGVALEVNPWMLGGTGNGIASDSAALRDTFALAAFGYKTISLGNNVTWNHDTPATRVQLYKAGAPLTGVTLKGDGYGVCMILTPPASPRSPLCARNVDGLSVSGIKFKANAAALIAQSEGFEVMNCTNVTAESNYFEGQTEFGLGVYEDVIAVSTLGSSQSGVHSVVYYDPVTGGNASKVVTISLADPAVIAFVDPPPVPALTYGKLLTFTTTGVLPAPFAAATVFEYLSNVGGTNFTVGVGPLACNNLTIRNNTFKDIGYYGIQHFPKAESSGCEIHNNVFIDCADNPLGAPIGTAPYAIKAGQLTKRSRIFNNKISCANANTSSGIAIGNYYDLEVFGNEIIDCNYSSIGISAIQHAITPAVGYSFLNVHDNQILFSTSVTSRSGEPGISFGADAESLAYLGPILIENNTINNDPGAVVMSFRPTAGSILSLTLTAGGSGYSATPTVTINDPTGTGASYGAAVVGGVIIGFYRITVGSNYTAPTVVITDGTGVGATANAVGSGATIFQNLKVHKNTIISDSSQVAIILSNVFGGLPYFAEISGNKFYNSNLTLFAAGRVDIEGANSTIITDNEWYRSGRNVIVMTSPTGENIIRGNLFESPNVDNTAGVAIIQVTSAVGSTNYIDRNTVRTGSGGFPKALIGASTSTPVFVVNGNILDDEAILIRVNATPTLGTGFLRNFAQYGNQRHYWGTAAPVSGGAFVAGDVVWNTTPGAVTTGWICTVGGSPGTWETFGQVREDIQTFTAGGTWTKPLWAKVVDVEVIGGGAGGGSGASGDNSLARGGGGGGAAGAHITKRFSASNLTATVAITIGAGGAGGAAVNGGAGAGLSGNVGTNGGLSSFGAYLFARTVSAGSGGTTSGGAAGTSTVFPAVMLGGAIIAAGGGGAGTTAAGTIGLRGVGPGGGAGGAGLLAAAGAGNAGAVGGAGASGASTGILEQVNSTGGGGTAGAAGTSGVAGGAGGVGTTRASPYYGDGGGSGGSGFPVATTSGGGNGGNGGSPGGGGGGGGAGRDGFNSGAGGNGVDGMCIVRSYG